MVTNFFNETKINGMLQFSVIEINTDTMKILYLQDV